MPGPRFVKNRKRLLHLALAGLITVLGLELCVRVVYAVKAGPRALLYGLVSDRAEQAVQHHDNIVGGQYSKYFPNQTRRDQDVETGESFAVTINNHGFRGEEFEVEKQAGVIRVVTLGASSTFGYHDRDDETYPHYLGKLLGEECPDRRFEVINLGIPHLDAEQVYWLFMNEGIPLDPDFVTFYEGINDSQGGAWRAPTSASLKSRVKHWLRHHSLLVEFISEMRKKRTSTAREVASHVDGRSEPFLSALGRIRGEARSRGMQFAVVTQQAQSGIKPREQMQGFTYAEDVELVRSQLERDGEINSAGLYLLTHNALMGELRHWASESEVPLIDGIAALDNRRDTLVSWVHINAEGNQILARAIADWILPIACSESDR